MDSREGRGGPAVLAEGMAKASKGREWESKACQGLAGMEILTSGHWKRREGNQNDGGKVLSEATLHSRDPDLHHHPMAGLGFASPLWVQGTPPCPPQAQASCLVYGVHSSRSHVASKKMVSGGKEELGAPR